MKFEFKTHMATYSIQNLYLFICRYSTKKDIKRFVNILINARQSDIDELFYIVENYQVVSNKPSEVLRWDYFISLLYEKLTR